MSGNNPQDKGGKTGNEGKKKAFLPKLPDRKDAAKKFIDFLSSVETRFTRYWSILMALALVSLGRKFTEYLPNADQIADWNQASYAFAIIAGLAVLVGFLDAYERSEVADMLWVGVACLLVGFVLTKTDDWAYIAIAYAIGFTMVYEASLLGKTDFTPLVVFNAVFLGASVDSHELGTFFVVPALMAVLFQVFETYRTENWQGIRVWIPGAIIATVGILFTGMNPLIWVVAGFVVSLFVAPTLLRLSLSKKWFEKVPQLVITGFALKNMKNLPKRQKRSFLDEFRFSYDGAMLTLVTSCVMILASLMFF